MSAHSVARMWTAELVRLFRRVLCSDSVACAACSVHNQPFELISLFSSSFFITIVVIKESVHYRETWREDFLSCLLEKTNTGELCVLQRNHLHLNMNTLI